VTYQRRFDASRYSLGYLLAQMPERDVQRGIVQYLGFIGAKPVEIDAGAKQLRASHGGFKGGAGAAHAGVVDIGCTLTGGRALWLEVKAPQWLTIGKRGKPVQARAAGEPTIEQLAFLDEHELAGALVGVAWSIGDVEAIVRGEA
jgi:hypothetical protein